MTKPAIAAQLHPGGIGVLPGREDILIWIAYNHLTRNWTRLRPPESAACPHARGYDTHMPVETQEIRVRTQGATQVLDLTPHLLEILEHAAIVNGTATLFVVGSTAGLTTTEYEPGLVNHDLRRCFEQLAPEGARYRHEETWHDDNGHAHVRASLLGPSLTVPVIERRPTLGTWQQIVLIDFDTRPRERRVVVQLVGEEGSG